MLYQCFIFVSLFGVHVQVQSSSLLLFFRSSMHYLLCVAGTREERLSRGKRNIVEGGCCLIVFITELFFRVWTALTIACERRRRWMFVWRENRRLSKPTRELIVSYWKWTSVVNLKPTDSYWQYAATAELIYYPIRILMFYVSSIPFQLEIIDFRTVLVIFLIHKYLLLINHLKLIWTSFVFTNKSGIISFGTTFDFENSMCFLQTRNC